MADSGYRARMDLFADVLTLAEAADRLGISATTLRHQAQAGRLAARLVGKTWVTTAAEVERYRRESLGRRRSTLRQPPTPGPDAPARRA